ncbi:MAG TPA: PaaI family thioesterase [Thermoanaerobaculia bacterium]|nr:PaaI family thioesterase [Thermoanaerobaculia bacterium]
MNDHGLTARRTMSGLDYMRRVACGEVEGAPMVHLLGMRMTEVDEGRVVIVLDDVRPEHENGLGIAHGGLAATLLDSALSCAVNTVMPAGKIFTTLEMKINYVRAIRRGLGPLSCIGTVVHAGGRTATAEGRIIDASGKLYAHGTVTCIEFGGRTSRPSRADEDVRPPEETP